MRRDKAERTKVTADDPGPSPAAEKRNRRLSPRSWRVPTRLAAIMVIPVLVGLVFAGLRVYDQTQAAADADEALRTAHLVRSSAGLADALQNERDLAATTLTAKKRTSPKLRQAYRKTDTALRDFRKHAGNTTSDTSRLQRRVTSAQRALAPLAKLRQQSYSSKKGALATQRAYSEMFAPLLAFDNELGLKTGDVTSRSRAVYAVSLAKSSLSTERNIISRYLVTKRGGTQTLAAVAAAQKLTETALTEFRSGALPPDRHSYDRIVRTEEAKADQKKAKAIATKAMASMPSGSPPKDPDLTPRNWYNAASTQFHLTRKAESEIVDDIVREVKDAKHDAQVRTVTNSAAVLLALLIAGIFTLVIARTMVRRMHKLRNGALEVAQQRLPDVVDRLSRTDPEEVDTSVQSMDIGSKDEIDEVAHAFDDVHRQAVRLAAEQALLRGNVNAIFTNLSRRSQGLIERQLSLITELENNEADPDQLGSLFKLDHLATRMRRNGENLLVLAGEDAGRDWDEPVPLVDVLRAAASEVEQYERVELTVVPELEIVGPAVNDLVHLLAELLENATAFSGPNTQVRVTGSRLQDGRVLVEIHDQGIGLTAEDFTEINDRLARPPMVDVSVSRRMGLFVVGRLASRHGIRTQLRASDDGSGTTSLVMLPEETTRPAAASDVTDFEVSAIMEGPASQEPERPHSAFGDTSAGSTEAAYRSSSAHPMPPFASGPNVENTAAAAAPPASAPPEPGPYERVPYEGPTVGFWGEPFPTERTTTESTQPWQPPAQEPHLPSAGETPYGDDVSTLNALSRSLRRQLGDLPAGPPVEPRQTEQPLPRRSQPHAHDPEPADTGPADTGYYPFQAGPAEQGLPEGQGFPGEQGLPGESAWLPPEQPPAWHAPESWQNVETTGSGPVPATTPPQAEYTPPGAHSAAPEYPPRNWQDQQAWQDWQGWYEETPNWRASANDERWRQAEQVREPSADGVTSSGLPKRMPRANLMPGTAADDSAGETDQQAESPFGFPVSRAPDDVRGRLTNLRRGVQQGRHASEGHGPESQEQ